MQQLTIKPLYTNEEMDFVMVYLLSRFEKSFVVKDNELFRICPICHANVTSYSFMFKNHVKSCSSIIYNKIIEIGSVFFGTLNQIRNSDLNKVLRKRHNNFTKDDEAFYFTIIDKIKKTELSFSRQYSIVHSPLWWENPKHFNNTVLHKIYSKYSIVKNDKDKQGVFRSFICQPLKESHINLNKGFDPFGNPNMDYDRFEKNKCLNNYFQNVNYLNRIFDSDPLENTDEKFEERKKHFEAFKESLQ